MDKVTGQRPSKLEILQLAEKIVELCREHTSNPSIAIGATEIAGKVMISEQFAGSASVQEPKGFSSTI